ncbi:MAG TPA: hypothetical protein GXX14_10950 [Clostridiaceae bacterium]|nr:hypothetical protein [Clostridiaceae bacterium]
MAGKIFVYMDRHLIEALGMRAAEKSVYKRCKNLVKQSIERYEKKEKLHGIYIKAKAKMKKTGYRGQYAAAVYLFVKYIVTAALFLVALVINFPSFAQPLIIAALNVIVVELVLAYKKRKFNLKFQKNAYKIYKYLHNQISSGVKVTDAIKTVYEVIDDRDLRGVLVELAARYGLTLDIDASLEEFKANFDNHEAETLCVALKQGVITGDNKDLLERQEDVMFKKYFNYIQAETDSCKARSVLAAAMFVAIIVIMITVPLLNDVTDAIQSIFSN